METYEKERIINRIISGTIRIPPYIIRKPSRDQLYIAGEIFHKVFQNAAKKGLFTEEELLEFMYTNELWTQEDQTNFERIPKDIDDFKLKLFQANFNERDRKTLRGALAEARKLQRKLMEKRHSYSHFSRLGLALSAKSKYILAVSIYKGNKPIFSDEAAYLVYRGNLIEKIMNKVNSVKCDDGEYRELARTDPWRSIWGSRKCEGQLFGCASVDYTDEQKTICGWSELYDSVYNHPECPSDEIVADDDMLDGFLISEKKKRDERQVKKQGNEAISEEVGKCGQIFIPVSSAKDAEKVDQLNDPRARAIKKQRMGLIMKDGKAINELDFPDQQMNISMAKNKMGP